MPLKPVRKPKVLEEKKPSPISRDCPPFFGYVRSLPKNTPIPDKCLGCPWIVRCLTHTAEKLEAKPDGLSYYFFVGRGGVTTFGEMVTKLSPPM